MAQDHYEDIYDDEQILSQEEETEYYDMSAFERRLMRRVNLMDNKLDRILDLAGDHNSRIRSIQFQYTKRTLFTLIKWGLIIFVVLYVYFNFIRPITSPTSEGGILASFFLSSDASDSGEDSSFLDFSIFQNLFTGADSSQEE